MCRRKGNNVGRSLGGLQCTSVAHAGPLQPRRWQTICLWHWAGVISVLICLNWIFYLILNLSITVAFQSEGTFPDSFHTGRSPRPARRSAPLAHLPVLFEKLSFFKRKNYKVLSKSIFFFFRFNNTEKWDKMNPWCRERRSWDWTRRSRGNRSFSTPWMKRREENGKKDKPCFR